MVDCGSLVVDRNARYELSSARMPARDGSYARMVEWRYGLGNAQNTAARPDFDCRLLNLLKPFASSDSLLAANF